MKAASWGWAAAHSGVAAAMAAAAQTAAGAVVVVKPVVGAHWVASVGLGSVAGWAA